MKIENSHSVPTVLTELGARLRRQRLDRNLTQAELAHQAGVSKRTLERLESGNSTQLTNLLRTLRALGLMANLNMLLPPPVPSPMALLSSTSQKGRSRASTSGDPAGASKPWTWEVEP